MEIICAVIEVVVIYILLLTFMAWLIDQFPRLP